MKKVLFDLKATQPTSKNSSKFHGGGEYTKELFVLLLEEIDTKTLEVFYDRNLYIEKRILTKAKEKNLIIHEISNKEEIQDLIYTGHYNTFISFLPYRYYKIDFKNTKTIFTVHGLRTIELPTDKYRYKYSNKVSDLFKYFLFHIFKEKKILKQKNKMQQIIEKGDMILVPSYHTKYSIGTFFPDFKLNKLEVIHSPIISYKLQKNNSFLNQHNLKHKKFFLLVSTDRWIKNAYRSILALDQLYENNQLAIKSVLIGGRKLLKYVKNKEMFICLNYLERNELELLYKEAYALIYPTLNEGFGYPPIEAMKYGTVVLSSSTTSIIEVCQDAVVYFNPYDINEMKNRILMIYHEDNLYKDYSKKALKQYQGLVDVQSKHLHRLINLIVT